MARQILRDIFLRLPIDKFLEKCPIVEKEVKVVVNTQLWSDCKKARLRIEDLNTLKPSVPDLNALQIEPESDKGTDGKTVEEHVDPF